MNILSEIKNVCVKKCVEKCVKKVPKSVTKSVQKGVTKKVCQKAEMAFRSSVSPALLPQVSKDLPFTTFVPSL